MDEKLKNLEQELSPEQIKERQKEAIDREVDRLFSVLEKDDFTVQDIWDLINNLAKNNPKVAEEFACFQENNSLSLKEMLKQDVSETREKNEFLQTISEDFKIWTTDLKILNNDLFLAYSRYNLNPEPLLKIAWSEKKVWYFLDFLKTEKWQLILQNTNFIQTLNWIWNDLWTANFETNSAWQKLSYDLFVESKKLSQNLKLLNQNFQNSIQNITNYEKQNPDSRYYPDEKSLQFLDESVKFKDEINSQIKLSAKNIFTQILASGKDLDVVKNWWTFDLISWENNISLNFWNLPKEELQTLNSENTPEFIEKYFDEVYVDNFSEILAQNWWKLVKYSAEHPEKLTVDVLSIVASGAITWAVVWASSLWAWPWWILLAGATFTASDNMIRWLWYEIIWVSWMDEIDWKKDFWEWTLEWFWLKNEDLNFETIATKKGFETLSNTALFWIFKVFSWAWNWWKMTFETFQKEALKIIPESTFFTYYSAFSSSIETSILSMQGENPANFDEAFETFKTNFSKINTAKEFSHIFMYNMWFIALVKGFSWIWNKAYDKFSENKIPKDFLEKNRKIDMEILALEEKWYTKLNDLNWNIIFFSRDWKKADIMWKDFENLRNLQEDLAKKSLDLQRLLMSDNSWKKSDNWSWTSAKNSKSTLEIKYEKLEKLSKEAEEKWLNFALWKENIYTWVKSSWLKDWTTEWLLKEAWFNKNDREAIRKQEVKEGSKKLEDRAVERMNLAVEKVYMEYIQVNLQITKFIKEWKDPYFELKDMYNSEIITKIKDLKKSL